MAEERASGPPLSGDVALRLEGGVAWVTIDRPARRNALAPSTLADLLAVAQWVRHADDVHAVVLTGAGDKAFCAGGDLMAGGGGGQGALAMHEVRGRYADVILAWRAMGRPSIARVQGDALGGGLGLVLACDFAIAAETARLGTPEVRVGLFPMMVWALLRRTVGARPARRLALLGERLTAREALAVGLVDEVVAADELDEAVGRRIEAIGRFSPAVLRLGLDAMRAVEDMPLEAALRHLHAMLTVNTLAEDAVEGVMAFMARRPPKWKGR